MTCSCITAFSFVFILASFPVLAQTGNLYGIYHSETYESDPGNPGIAAIQHILTLNTDSSFIYKRNSGQLKCNYVYAGNWRLKYGKLLLEFSEEDTWIMEVNEGRDFCSIIKQDDGIIFFKSDQDDNVNYPSDKFNKTTLNVNNLRKKKKKKLDCPNF